MASATANAPLQQKQARRHDHPRVIAAASNPGIRGTRSPRATRGRGGAGGPAPSGSCDPCGRTVHLSHVTPFAFSVIATLPALTRPQIPESKPSGADPAPNYSAAPNYGVEGCPAVRFIVHDPHQVLGWCRSDTIIRWFGVRSAPSQRLVQRMGETPVRKESNHWNVTNHCA